jgi:S-adenosyl-L-methionine hydrolase (adenosine-forming)
MPGYEWVSFTTDYGEADGFTAVCRGVIAQIAPAARVIDVTHQVPPQDVRRGAGVLAQTLPWLPPAVHLAVVDPGVGTDRRGLCLVTNRSVLIGPDNGLLVPAAAALGGTVAAYQLDDPAYWLPPISATFHGRDVFAPVAAHLCTGVEPSALGPELPLDSLVQLPAPAVTVGVGRVAADVRTVDAFGNVQLAATADDLAAAGISVGDRAFVHIGPAARPALVATTFGDVGPGELIVYLDAAGYAAVAVNGGSAATTLDVRDTDSVLLLARPGAAVRTVD